MLEGGDDTALVVCPWCGEQISLYVDPGQQTGTFTEDCEVCCRPWRVSVARQGGELWVDVQRS